MLRRIISGGQSGVDRAALDAARALGYQCGGWCPRGRLAEDGPIDPRYPLGETPSADPAQRTRWNVAEADGTLVLTSGVPGGGTALTIEVAHRLHQPCLVVPPAHPSLAAAAQWLEQQNIRVLNVAGPRESQAPGIYAASLEFLRQLFARG